MFEGRSMPSWRALVLVALVAFAFWRPLFAGGTLAPVDQFWLSDPFNADPPAELTIDVAERDAAAIHGWWVGWADDIRSGDVGWWRDVGAGEPFFAEGLPVTHLVYLVVPGWYAPGLVAALTVLIAAVGAMRLGDRQRLAPVAGLFAGIVFGFSGLMFVWIGWPHATAIALAPWVVAGLLSVRSSPSGRGAVSTATVFAAQLWCGVFAIAVFTLMGALAWVAGDAWRDRDRRGLGAVGASALLGALFAAPHLWPRWERWSWADTSHLDAGDSSAPVVGLITTVFGSALGNESVGVAWLETSSFQLTVGFIGAAATVAFVVAAVAGRVPAGAALLAGLGIAFAFIGGPLDTVAGLLVGDASLASHARVLLVLALAFMAAVGIDTVVDAKTASATVRDRLVHRTVQTGLGVAALGVGAGLIVWLDVLRDGRALRAVGAEVLVTIVVLAITVSAVVAWLRQRITGAALAVAILTLGVYELLAFGMPIPTVTDRGERPEATAAHDALFEAVGDRGRIAGDHDAFPPFAAARFDVSDVRSPGLRSSAEVAAFAAVDPTSVLGAAGGGPFEPVVRVRDDADPYRASLWDLLGVDAWVLPRDGTPPGQRFDPTPETRTALAVAAPLGSIVIPEHGLRAVVVDLAVPAFTPIGVEVHADGVTVTTRVVLRSSHDGPVAIPIAGERLTPGSDANVVVTVDTADDTAEAGTTGGALALGTIAGDPESELVWVDGVLIVARPTPRVVWDGPGSAVLSVTADHPGRLTIDVGAEDEGVLRSDIVDEPGWTVTIDGNATPAETVDGIVLAVEVPAGAHTVEFAYGPPRFGAGLALGSVGLFFAAAWLIAEARRGSPTL